MQIKTLILVSCVAFFGTVSSVFADYDVTGRWASTSGSTIVIPDSPTDFIMVVTHKDGEVFKLKAQWVKGLVGTQFVFINEYGRKVTATIDSQDKNKVRLSVEDRVYYWQRM